MNTLLTKEELNFIKDHDKRCPDCDHLKLFHDNEYGCAICDCDRGDVNDQEFWLDF
jgi:hypothetical protein